MALRSTASVATAVKRRGSGALGVNDFIWLQENSKEVKRISKLLDEHAKTARVAEKTAIEAEVAAKVRLAEVAEAQTALDDRTAAFEQTVANAAATLESDVDALERRTSAVFTKERDSDGRSTALDVRKEKLDARDLARETELQAREDDVEARETAAEGRDRTQQETAAGLAKRTTTIETASTMLKQAAASLR